MNDQAPAILLEHEGQQHYGAILGPQDPRNHDLASYVPIAEVGLPVSYYPNLDGIPHWMQNRLGACVGHASGKSKQVSVFHENGTIAPLSARFIYAMCKALEGTHQPEGDFSQFAPTTEGTYPELAAKVLQKIGVATEATVPNNTLLDHETYVYQRNRANIPGQSEAAAFKISNYSFAPITEAGIKTAIQFAGENKGGVFMLVALDKAWWTAKDGATSWSARDILPLRAPIDQATMGGHEVYPYAFDEIDGRTIIRVFNSWSDQWGDGGNGYFFLDEYLPHIVQVISVVDLPSNYQADAWRYTFTRALKLGMSGSDVVALQHALRIDGEFTYPTLTGYFGPVTLAAVKAFQEKYASEILSPVGLTQPTGFVGTMTLKKLNSIFSA